MFNLIYDQFLFLWASHSSSAAYNMSTIYY